MAAKKAKAATNRKTGSEGKSAVSKAKPAAKGRGKSKWFDEATSAPLISEKAKQLKGFLAAMADGVIDKKELKAQEERLIEAMKEVEPLLSAEQHAKVTELLCELTAYDLMQVMHAFHKARPKTEFQG